MKVALAQLNYIPGDISYNSGKIISAIHEAHSMGAELVIFSELAVVGYPPLDLLNMHDIISGCMKAIKEIAGHCTDIGAIVGGPSPNTGVYGKAFHNTAFMLYQGKVKAMVHKTLLPTYDVFDEDRYFEPGDTFFPVDFKDMSIALTICEDLWEEQPYGDRGLVRLYGLSPLEEMMRHRPDFIVNIAANPFSHNKIKIREEIFCKNAKKYNMPLVSVNQVGGYTELLFDGNSVVINSKGEIVKRLPFFEENISLVEIPEGIGQNKRETSPSHKEGVTDVIPVIHKALVTGIRDYFTKSGIKKAVVGLSGGIDSAVVLALAVEALGRENVMAILMPSCFSSSHSVTDAVEMANILGIEYHIVKIEEARNAFEGMFEPFFKGLPADITEENIQARIRAVILMAFSNKFGHMVLNTSNKSEAAVGYGTLYGDMAGGLSVIGDIYKTEVYKLASEINAKRVIIPQNIIDKPPSAELKPGQFDTDSLPPYNTLDPILYRYIDMERSASMIISEGYDPDVVKKVVKLVRGSEYKRRQTPPVLRVSSKAFGSGRRIPLVAKY
ncbi:MAG TPA: NAD+ synthase [Bacteroidales bacterium]|nr:NAD+ synthase [Bacteroidales bacterium]